MKRKKILFLCFIAMIFASCDKDVGYKDIHLNVTAYTFAKEGGDLKVYSTDKNDFAPCTTDPRAEHIDKNPAFTIKGEWYTVRYTAVKDTTYIHVEPNQTGKERILPIQFVSFARACPHVIYKQSK